MKTKPQTKPTPKIGGGKPGGAPGSVTDRHVGARIRLRRNMLELSQEKLGAALGLTFQQVQKYERGANRVSASRLAELTRILDVPVAFFFDDTDPVKAAPVEEARAPNPDPILGRADVQALIDRWKRLDEGLQERFFDLAIALAAAIGATPVDI